jgi:hypothetical protein
MQKKTWAAVFAAIAGTSVAVSQAMPKSSGEMSDDPPATAPAKSLETLPSNTGTPKNGLSVPLIKLSLVVAGLEHGGCDVDVKAGNAGCKFRPVSMLHVSKRESTIDLRDVEMRSSDRLLSVAITIHEAGQQPRTIYRAFRLSAKSATAATPPTIACFVSSPSKVARIDEAGTVKK